MDATATQRRTVISTMSVGWTEREHCICVLYFVHDYKQWEIAERLGCTRQAVTQSLRQAIEKARRKTGRFDLEPELLE